MGGLALAALAAVVSLLVVRGSRLPAQGTPVYEETTRSFYRGLASLQVGQLDQALKDFTRATELVPEEPASWANLGLTNLRLGEFEAAVAPLERAAALAPDNSHIAFLQGQLDGAGARARPDASVSHFRRAVELDGRNLLARFAIVQELGRSGKADPQARQELENLYALETDNLVVLLERARLAARTNDAAVLRDSVARIEKHRDGWSPMVLEQFAALDRALAAQDLAEASRALAFVRNVLLPTPAFQEGLARVAASASLFAEPFDRFLALVPPDAAPSPADTVAVVSHRGAC